MIAKRRQEHNKKKQIEAQNRKKKLVTFKTMLASFREKQAIQMISFQKNSDFFFLYKYLWYFFRNWGSAKGDKQAYSKLVIERYEKILDDFTEERAHTHRGRCAGKEAFQDLYKLIQADKKIAQSFDTAMFERIVKIEKSVKNYENFLYNQEHSASPKSTLEHSQAPAKKLDHDNQFKL